MRSRPAPRVANTRDEDHDGPLATALRDAGLTSMPCPAVVIRPPVDPAMLARVASSLDRYDWLVVASSRAVAAILDARHGEPLPAGLRTAAVGESTAGALRLAGARSVLVGREGGARGLIPPLLSADHWPGRLVLVPRAEQGGEELAEALRGRGAHVDEVTAYCTQPRPGCEIAASWREAAPVAAVVVTSPSAARALVGAIGTVTLRALDAVVAIGPTTAKALADLGVPAVTSESTDFAAVAWRTRQALREIPARELPGEIRS